MADNIAKKDRSGVNVDIASKDLGSGVQLLRHMLTDVAGTDIDPPVKAQLPTTIGTKTASASLSVTPASDAAFQITSTGFEQAVDTTRPANTTAYAAGDVVGGAVTFTTVGASNGHVLINTLQLRYDVGAIPTGMTAFRLHLYSATPPSAYADNAAWDLPSGDRSVYLGFIDLGGMIDLGSTLFNQIDNVGKQVRLGSGSTALYAYMQTVGAYTPAANSEVFRLTMNTVGV